MAVPKPPGRSFTSRDLTRTRDEAFARIVDQLAALARRPQRRKRPHGAWEWFDADVQAKLAAQGEAHPVHGRYALHPELGPRFLSANELPYPWNRYARRFPDVYRHPLEACQYAERAFWELRFCARDVHDLAVDLRDGLEDGLAVMARRFVRRGRRRKLATLDRLTRLNAFHAYGGPFDVVRGALIDVVRAANRAVTWLTAVAALVPPPEPTRIEPLRVAAFRSAVWLVQHHPKQKIVYPDLVTVLLAGRWDQADLLEHDSEPTALVRKAVRHEAERRAGRRLDEAALVTFLRTRS